MSNWYFTNLPEEPNFFYWQYFNQVYVWTFNPNMCTVFPPNFIVNKYLIEMFGLKVHNSHWCLFWTYHHSLSLSLMRNSFFGQQMCTSHDTYWTSNVMVYFAGALIRGAIFSFHQVRSLLYVECPILYWISLYPKNYPNHDSGTRIEYQVRTCVALSRTRL